jgi:hypothetical protein
VVRLDTYKASAFLVWQLRHAGIRVLEDGGDIIHAKLPTGETISIHLIESSIPLYEIRSTLLGNEANGMHTLFILWCDMLLPPEDEVIEPHDWEQALLALYGESIFAYEIYGAELFIFPVHFDRYGQHRVTRYGETLNIHNLTGSIRETAFPPLKGQWRVAGFGQRPHHTHRKTSSDREHYAPPAPPTDRLSASYFLLGLQPDCEPEVIKTAYRRMARKLHPDLNKAPDATARMQALNEAYRILMAQFDDE